MMADWTAFWFTKAYPFWFSGTCWALIVLTFILFMAGLSYRYGQLRAKYGDNFRMPQNEMEFYWGMGTIGQAVIIVALPLFIYLLPVVAPIVSLWVFSNFLGFSSHEKKKQKEKNEKEAARLRQERENDEAYQEFLKWKGSE